MPELDSLEVPVPAPPAPQFDRFAQRTEAAHLGMWLFLSTELLFFGGLFAAYAAYRFAYPEVFAAAAGRLSVVSGTLDTLVLLTSSYVMATAVHAAQTGQRGALTWRLLAAAGLGALFLVLHGWEYAQDVREHHWPGPGFRFEGGGGDNNQASESNRAQLFFVLYFTLTGLHSLHVAIGVVALTIFAVKAWRWRYSSEYYTPVELVGLYWHFVDLVWVFLFPLLYLIPRHSLWPR